MQSWIFSVLYYGLQCHMTTWKSFECADLLRKLTEYFLLLKKVVLHNMDHDVFFQDSLMNRKFKRTAFLTRNLTVVVVVYRSLRIWMKSQPGTSSPWLHSHEICSATSTSRSAMEVIGRCVNIFRTHTFPFLFILISTLFRDKMATINFTIVHLSFLAFVQKMEEHLVRTKKEKPTFIPYYVSACRDLPGKFLLGYQPRGKPR